MKQINVLIVDDSPVAREILIEIFSGDPEIHVAGTAKNGRAALAFLKTHSVDVITMDVIMPDMDGFATTRAIMETKPTPIVIISSSYKEEEVAKSFKAIEAGAVAILGKPGNVTDTQEFEQSITRIRETVKTMAGVKVVKRWGPHGNTKILKNRDNAHTPLHTNLRDIKVIAVGASTGGPIALRDLFQRMPATLPVPVLLVQHISGTFLGGMLKWLIQSTGFMFKTAENDELAEPGKVYVAPDGLNMNIDPGGRIKLTECRDNDRLCPSVDSLFYSVARSFGEKSIGVLLTGMGGDGSRGMKELYQCGAFTIAQDEDTCVVYGMPAEAVKLGAVKHLLPLEKIAHRIVELVGAAHTRKIIKE